MKRIMWVACLGAVLILAGACKKGSPGPAVALGPAVVSVIGTWEIRSAQNSIVPTISYPPGNDSLLKFTATDYSLYSKGHVVRTGAYQIVEDHSFNALVVPAGQFTSRIVFEGSNDLRKMFFQITGNTLRFLAGNFAIDGGSDVVYERK